jgi:hypothetical protein
MLNEMLKEGEKYEENERESYGCGTIGEKYSSPSRKRVG